MNDDPVLTKAKILAEHAKRRRDEACNEYERLWLDFVKKCKRAGYCANCEKRKIECKCVVYAYMQEHAASMPHVEDVK